MNLRTRYKRLKQYVDFAKIAPPVKIFFDSTNLEHFRCKTNSLLPYGIDSDTDEHALRVAKGKIKNEFSKLIDEYIEVLPDGTVTLDVWFKPKSSLIKDGVTIVEDTESEDNK